MKFCVFFRKDNKYASQFSNLLHDKSYRQSFFLIVPAVTTFVESLGKRSQTMGVDYEDDFVRFAVLCLETAHFLVLNDTRSISPRELEFALKCAQAILADPSSGKAFGCSNNYSWVCSAAAALTTVVHHFCQSCEEDDLPIIDEQCSGLQEAMKDEGAREYAVTCLRMAALVMWLERRQRIGERSAEDIPRFFAEPLKSLIISVARQPLVNSFVLTPPLLWKHECPIVGTGPTKLVFYSFCYF